MFESGGILEYILERYGGGRHAALPASRAAHRPDSPIEIVLGFPRSIEVGLGFPLSIQIHLALFSAVEVVLILGGPVDIELAFGGPIQIHLAFCAIALILTETLIRRRRRAGSGQAQRTS